MGQPIRSYVFHPYKMIKTTVPILETGNVQPVMDGELDGFVKAYLMSEKTVSLNIYHYRLYIRESLKDLLRPVTSWNISAPSVAVKT